MAVGMRQAELAKQVGISAAYLNLIEHNRRRIAGKLLLDIAAQLNVDAVLLSEGAEAALLMGVQQAVIGHPDVDVEQDRVEEFAGRFPGWAALVAAQNAEADQLRQAVETLNDRLSHDPFLAAALHEVISTVSSIQSSASILVESPDLEKEWRDRFQRNIFEDSQRLAETSQSLVGYLDPGVEDDLANTTPQEELDAYLASVDYTPDPSGDALDGVEAIKTEAGREVAQRFLEDFAAHACHISDEDLAGLEAETDDLAELAERSGLALHHLFQRLAFRPKGEGRAYGYISTDASGAILAKRPLSGFTFPRLGAGCPIWPLYTALSQPLVPIQAIIRQVGRDSEVMEAYAIAVPDASVRFGQAPRITAHMLLSPARQTGQNGQDVGVNCRICAAVECAARREPSVLSQEF